MPARLAKILEIVSLPLAVAVLLLLGMLLYRSGQTFRRARMLEKQAESVIRDINALEAASVDAETGQRGYLLTGREAYLDPLQPRAGPDSRRPVAIEIRHPYR